MQLPVLWKARFATCRAHDPCMSSSILFRISTSVRGFFCMTLHQNVLCCARSQRNLVLNRSSRENWARIENSGVERSSCTSCLALKLMTFIPTGSYRWEPLNFSIFPWLKPTIKLAWRFWDVYCKCRGHFLCKLHKTFQCGAAGKKFGPLETLIPVMYRKVSSSYSLTTAVIKGWKKRLTGRESLFATVISKPRLLLSV